MVRAKLSRFAGTEAVILIASVLALVALLVLIGAFSVFLLNGQTVANNRSHDGIHQPHERGSDEKPDRTPQDLDPRLGSPVSRQHPSGSQNDLESAVERGDVVSDDYPPYIF